MADQATTTTNNPLTPGDEQTLFRQRFEREQEMAKFGRRLQREKGMRKGRLESPGFMDDHPTLPLMDRIVIAGMDKDKKDVVPWLESKYGKGSVSADKRGLLVDVGGRKMRVSTGFVAEQIGGLPETVGAVAGGIAGSAAGAALGPGGAVVGGMGGAATGGAAGRAAKEALLAGWRAKEGLPGKKPEAVASDVAQSAMGGMEGELMGRAGSRVLKGPLPEWLAGTSAKTKAMTSTFQAEGGKAPIGSALPTMKFMQRQIKKAEILTGKDTGTTRQNVEYLQGQAAKILTKAGVPTASVDAATERMIGSESALSLTEAGRIVQNTSRTMKGQAKGKTAKYLTQLSSAQTPEDAVSLLLQGGQRDRLENVFKFMGKNSQFVQQVQHQALKQVLADTLTRSERDGGEALFNALKQFTAAQKKLLFPDGVAQDMQILAEKMKFAFPHPQELGMPGWTTGSQFEKKFYIRWYYQGTSAIWRTLLQHPVTIRWLATGFKQGGKYAQSADIALRTMFQDSALGAADLPPVPQDQGQPAAHVPHPTVRRGRSWEEPAEPK